MNFLTRSVRATLRQCRDGLGNRSYVKILSRLAANKPDAAPMFHKNTNPKSWGIQTVSITTSVATSAPAMFAWNVAS